MASPAIVHFRDVQPRPRFFTVWERQRHGRAHPLVECFAEFLGVFLYVYCGVGSTATWVLANLLKETDLALSSLFQIGFAYAAGIVFAITICSATSGGHFNPCVSIAFVIFKKFPPLKAARYIVAQILGAYIACLLVYAQYRDLIVLAEQGLTAAGAYDTVQFTPNGPAGIFALYVLPTSNLGRVFLNEFVTDIVLAMVIWGCIDPSNVLVPPSVAAFVVALAYAAAIWGYAMPGVALNSARDVGGRLAALSLWGTKAAGGKYAAIAALTNIPAMIIGALLYEFLLVDSDRVIGAAHREFIDVHRYHGRNTITSAKHDSEDMEKGETEHMRD